MIYPFDLKNSSDYSLWREQKLASVPGTVADLVVEVSDPFALSRVEREALMFRVRRCNMALYASPALEANTLIPRALGLQFGLEHLDANWLAYEDGISEIKVTNNGTRQAYIPYTNRPIKWHTDGYYNPPERKVLAMVLHCVRSAAKGGESHLMDHELAYLLLRDQDPAFIYALMQEDAMTIPERIDETDGIRQAQSGPVFSVDALTGRLHMRYTARTRSIQWKQDAVTLDAVAALEKLLNSSSPYVYQARLEPGMGLLCNNVLHDRAGFIDNQHSPRLIYRARYCDLIRDV